MICNTRNWSNNATESQKDKKKPILLLIFKIISQKSWGQLRCGHYKA